MLGLGSGLAALEAHLHGPHKGSLAAAAAAATEAAGTAPQAGGGPEATPEVRAVDEAVLGGAKLSAAVEAVPVALPVALPGGGGGGGGGGRGVRGTTARACGLQTRWWWKVVRASRNS